MDDWGEPGVSRGQQRFKTNGFSGGALNAQLNFWEKQSQVSVIESQGLVNSEDREKRASSSRFWTGEVSDFSPGPAGWDTSQNSAHRHVVSGAASLAALQQVSWRRHHRDCGTKCHATLLSQEETRTYTRVSSQHQKIHKSFTSKWSQPFSSRFSD